MKRKEKRIFLDYASITPIDQKVERKIFEAKKKFWANPSSLHKEGDEAKNALEEARTKIARIMHCRSNEIFFTSGGTESLNIAIFGIVESALKNGKLPHIICSSIEHTAILEPLKKLVADRRAEVSFVSPNKDGLINPESIKRELKENTVLVAIQHANNEIGTIQPIREISKIIKDFQATKTNKAGEKEIRPFLLVDASQSVLYENISIERLGADMLALDGIKMYGPRGAGILAIKREVNISPIIFGGGQESGVRPGTSNVPAAVGLAEALEIAQKMREKESSRLTKLQDYAIKKILNEVSPKTAGQTISINGSLEKRLPNNINICLPGQDSEFLVIKLDTLGFAVSAASACHALSLENSSFVIKAIGKPECASSSLRITLGRGTKKSDLDKFISVLAKILK